MEKIQRGVSDGLGNIRVANQQKDFKKALELVGKLRSEYQLDAASEKMLKNQETWAQRHETEKERQRKVMAQGELKFNEGDYQGAIKDFDIMYPTFNTYWNINFDSEPKKYGDLKAEAVRRQKRISELVPSIKRTIDLNANNDVLLNSALKNVDELLGFKPGNSGISWLPLDVRKTVGAKGQRSSRQSNHRTR